ncbi:MAG: GTPase ObgE [Candidatus Saccharibacteria bacterium]
MSFIDKANIKFIAGDGGNGNISFRHEKFIDRGGPDGGDGGNGGNVVLIGSNNENTLSNFRYQKEVKAEPGRAGDKQKKHGRSGKDIIISMPLGTVVYDENDHVLADITVNKQKVIIAKGGRGGFGNAHFISSVRQAPRFAEKGEPGEYVMARLELKSIADVGLIGLPNAGKSTLLSVISNARPEIANYPFTTLTPNLGVADIDKHNSLLFADIPGLIEGAAKGKGLGDEFLRHVERTLVLVHLIDAYQENISKAYKTIQKELKLYSIDLTERPQIIVINKTEALDDKSIAKLSAKIEKIAPKGTKILAISGATHKGLDVFLREVNNLVNSQKKKKAKVEEVESTSIPVLRLNDDDSTYKIAKGSKSFIVTGKNIEKFASRTDFDNPDSVQRLRDIMKKTGLIQDLSRQGLERGQKIYIGNKGEMIY